MRYRHYDLDQSITGRWQALGVSGVCVFEHKSQDQVKKWIDQEWKLSQERIVEGNLQAWYNGSEQYTIGTIAPIEAVATAKLRTTRERREDYSGKYAYAVITKTELTVTFRIGVSGQVTLDQPFIEYTGPKTALRMLMKRLADKSLLIHVRMQLEMQVRKAGASELNILDTWDADEEITCRNLLHLLKKLEA